MDGSIIDHQDRAHAKLSASGANRWINCPASPQVEELFPEMTSDASAEGTLAHELAELEQRRYLDTIQPADYYDKLDVVKRSSYYRPEMDEYVKEYTDYVLGIYNDGLRRKVRSEIHVEIRLNLSAYIPEGFGTSDNFLLIGDTLHIIDLKYGFMYVNAYDNPQLKIYAIGALEYLSWDFDIEKVVLHVVQPRIGNFSTYETDPFELARWGERELKPLALRAFDESQGEQVAGTHCMFCRAAGSCAVLSGHATDLIVDAQVKGAKLNRFKLLDDNEKSNLFLRKDMFKLWYDAFSRHMEVTAKEGKQYKGLKFVEGQSRRAVKDEENLIDALNMSGLSDEELYTKKLKPISELEKLAGKDFVKDYIHKPKGKQVLTNKDDPRADYISEDADVFD